MEKVSVVVVNYNSTRYLNLLIKSIDTIKSIVEEIIIVDNNSTDKIDINRPKSLNIKIVRNKKNLGFARAVNIGVRQSKNTNILLLNPDTFIVNKSPISTYKIFLNDKNIGAIGGRIKNKNKKGYMLSATTFPNFFTSIFEFTNLKKIFPNNLFSNRFWLEKNKTLRSRVIEVDSLCGAYLFFRKLDKNKRINTFDENFFLYLEDLDFCLQLKIKGYKIIFDSNSKILHVGGSSNDSVYGTALKHWYQSRKYFFTKHLGKFLGGILYIIYTTEESALSLYHFITNTPNE